MTKKGTIQTAQRSSTCQAKYKKKSAMNTNGATKRLANK